jgi:hypothetical protein
MRAYWQLRLAVGAARGDPPLPGLDETLTLSGAVRWALDNMPASRDEAIAYQRELDAIPDDPPGTPLRPPSGSWGPPPPHIATLQGVTTVLGALGWIDLSQLDESARAQVQAWLGIRRERGLPEVLETM